MPDSEQSRLCPHCQHELGESDTNFCPACGRAFLSSKRRRLWVRTGIIAGAVCMLIALGIFFDDMYDPNSIFRRIGRLHDPVYQWVESDSRTFDFLPGEGKGWGPVNPQQGEIRYDIRAALPVDTGLMDSKWADRMDAWSFLSRDGTCFQSNIRRSAKSCRLSTGKAQVIFIRDRRPKQAGLDFEKMYGTRGSLAEPNSVTITILTRKCVENCKYALD